MIGICPIHKGFMLTTQRIIDDRAMDAFKMFSSTLIDYQNPVWTDLQCNQETRKCQM